MKPLLRWAARALLGDYALYRIVGRSLACLDAPSMADGIVEVDAAAVSESPDPLVRDQVGFCGDGAHLFAVLEGRRIVALAAYWHGERYRSRNFWPLQAGEAKLVQIVTVPDRRGAGHATRLIEASSRRMAANGFQRLYARIWHNNHPSLNAFAKANWEPVATVAELRLFGVLPRWRIVRAVVASRKGGATAH